MSFIFCQRTNNFNKLRRNATNKHNNKTQEFWEEIIRNLKTVISFRKDEI